MKPKRGNGCHWGVSQDFFFMHRAYVPAERKRVIEREKEQGCTGFQI